MTAKSIFEFLSYRAYLEAYVGQQPKQGWGVLSRIAEAAQLSSAQLSHVLHKQREFTMEQGLRVARFLGLSDGETQFFLEMIILARAGTKELRDFSKKRLEKLKKEGLKLQNQVPPHQILTDHQNAQFYSSWIYSAIRLYCSIKPRQLEEVMSHFQLGRDRVAEALNFLTETGLCIRGDQGTTMGQQTTFIPRTSPFVHKHHANWRIKALQLSEEHRESELFFTSPVSLSRRDFERFRVKWTEAIKEFSSEVRESREEMVGCLNIDFFEVR